MLAAVLLMTAVLSGCFGDDEGDDTDDGGDPDGGAGGNETDEPDDGGGAGNNTTDPDLFEPTVTLDSVPGTLTTGNDFTVNWTIEGDEGESVDETGVIYGQASVSEPNATTDYNESAGVETDVTVPANFTVNITLESNGTWYVRAYAKVGDKTYFSTEGQIAVADEEVTEIRIEAESLTDLEPFPYIHADDEEMTVSIGEPVVWVNNDDEDQTITFDTVPEGAEPGDVDVTAGGVSDQLRLTVAGEYVYTLSGDTGSTDYKITVE